MYAGRLDLIVPEFIREIDLELAALLAARGPQVLTGKVAGGCPLQRMEDIAHGDLDDPFFLPDRLLEAGIYGAEGVGLECSLPDGGRGVEARDVAGPAVAQANGLLGEEIHGQHVEVDRSAGAETGIVKRVIGVEVRKETVPAQLQGIADVEAGDILCRQVLLGQKSFGPVRGVDELGEDVFDVAIIQCRHQLTLVHICKPDAIRVLWPQVGVPFLVGILVELELEGVEILISGPVDAATIGERPLTSRVFI